MSPELGTLAGLIADLEELCRTGNDLPDPPYWRELNTFDVLNLIREHKRAKFLVMQTDPHTKNAGLADEFCVWSRNARMNDPFLMTGTKAECEAWIDRQVNGDE